MTERPIFVVGCPRSGTTLLQLMLHAHPRVAIPPETRFLIQTYLRRRRYGDLRERANRVKIADAITGRKSGTKLSDLGIDRTALRADIIDGEPALAAALSAPFRAYAAKHGKPRWGEKRPAYFSYIPELRALFPDAQIVSILRDGRDCVASLKQARWYRREESNAVSTWTMAVDFAEEARRDCPADAFYELRYEDLVGDPEGELRKLCDFLGEEFDAVMLASHEVADVAVPERKEWHDLTREEVTTRRVGSFAERLTPREIALCEWAMGERLTAHGYGLTGAPRPPLGDRLRYRRVDTLRRLAVRRRRLSDRIRNR